MVPRNGRQPEKVDEIVRSYVKTYGSESGNVLRTLRTMDEYTIECKPEISKIVAKEAEDAIRWANDFFKNPCPHIGHAAIGDNWFSIH